MRSGLVTAVAPDQRLPENTQSVNINSAVSVSDQCQWSVVIVVKCEVCVDTEATPL